MAEFNEALRSVIQDPSEVAKRMMSKELDFITGCPPSITPFVHRICQLSQPGVDVFPARLAVALSLEVIEAGRNYSTGEA